MSEDDIRSRIIEVLKQNPAGITMIEIASLIGMSRVTVSKYMLGLISEGIVNLRMIGPAKLCCLKVVYA